ncbi:prolipoprotein diacylglyceryl transferase [Paenibacillus chondroitinus]|uniref:Phosphatidylglycerol--prolipoprotein diacylglyceryl transferase n=1 Tax=Paenibacillus chondroitinus TaxID=59842 RepID=A0ABU6DGP2_9BACL|nr:MULTISPECIES: prolipoprotein diacylglyceryl transferase [Paenibacillus]MCY9659444.1 prolipoprotein diacylglyceryl transferase [Paenibacillus anseongense]MEB4796839.1 prolipoprotein diacylglyceryl transferase [Paenibacillus chondroitinus]
MRVILFNIGDFPIRSYGLIVGIAILLGLGVAYFLARGTKYQNHVLNMITYIILGAIVGARLWEVFFFQFGYYSKHWLEAIAIWQGGLSIQGGLVGGFIAGAIYARVQRISFWEFADITAPAIVLSQSVGRIACFLNGDAFGSPTGSNFGLVYPPGTIAYETYGSQPLWPAEIWEGQWDLVIFALLIILKNKQWPKGFLFLIYNILYALGRFMLEYLRGDTPRYALGWTAAQWTSFGIVAVSILLIGYFTMKEKRQKEATSLTEH